MGGIRIDTLEIRCAKKDNKYTESKNAVQKNVPDGSTREDRLVAALGLLLHIPHKRRLARKRESAERIHYYVHPEHLYYGDRIIHSEILPYERNSAGGKVHNKLEGDEFPYRLEYSSAVEDGLGNCLEAVVEDNYISCALCYIRTAAHSEADVGKLQ